MNQIQQLREATINILCLIRDNLEVQYFFNAGIDKETGICDGEGSDIYVVLPGGRRDYQGSLYGYHPLGIAGMDDDQFREALEMSFRPYVKKPERS